MADEATPEPQEAPPPQEPAAPPPEVKADPGIMIDSIRGSASPVDDANVVRLTESSREEPTGS